MALFCAYCKYENREISKFCSKCGKLLQAPPVELPPIMGTMKMDTILVGRYKVIELIKAGGMGAVYKGLDEKLNCLCAIKELLPPPNTPDIQKQVTEWFKREALMLARLDHPSIPKVSDYFVYGSRYYLVMNFIEGEDLLKLLLKEGKPGLGEEQVIEWAKQILEVLDYLHNQDPPVIYRDLKPSNVMLQKDGRVKLIDFGIARTLQHDSDAPKTVIGTAGYSPLEQYRGKPEKRSDLFSLGATMHHLLTGMEPETLNFDPLREVNPSLSQQIEKVVLKALQDKVEDRYRNAREMMKALDFKENNISRRVKNIISDWANQEKEKVYIKTLKSEAQYGVSAPGNWQVLCSDTGFGDPLWCVHFLDENNGWAAGGNGKILNTSDGGYNWEVQRSGVSMRKLYSLFFLNLQTGWIAGSGGTILYTDDGGLTWKKQRSIPSWHIFKGINSETLYGIHFVDKNNGWAVGEKGIILRTFNGGNGHWWNIFLPGRGTAWKTQKSRTGYTLYGVNFVDINNGWAVGEVGTILYTSDGGKNWSKQESGIARCLRGLHMIDLNNGWAAGELGTILHTKDGGNVWITMESGVSDYLHDIHFHDLNNGWAVGRDGTIIQTIDGGITWKSQCSMTQAHLQGINFFNCNNGWAVGSRATILKYFRK